MRHTLDDTQGLLMHAIVHAADIQDRDGGAFVMATMFGMYPFLMKIPVRMRQTRTRADQRESLRVCPERSFGIA